MKKILVLLPIILLTLTACKPTAPEKPSDDKTAPQQVDVKSPGESDHMGCQEGEIDKDGKCVPADINNTSLFDQDLDPFVETEDYKSDEVMGFIAKPKNPGTYPGIVMIHEWWGLNDNIKYMAKLLAKEGYAVFAVDLYDGDIATESDKARELMTAAREDQQTALRKMKAAMRYLYETEGVKTIGSIGWCFGGGQSFQLALNDRLDATVIYYGHVSDDKEQLKNITWPVMGVFGRADTGIPVDSVIKFQAALILSGIKHEILIYPGVGHAFANPTGSNYAPLETQDAWNKTITFLDTYLKTESGKTDANGYSCPNVEYLNCMPTTGTPHKMCEKNYLQWIEENCEVEIVY